MFGFLLVVCNEQGAGSLASPEHHSEVGLIRHTSCFSVEIVLQMPLDETVLTKVLRCRCYNQSINQSINRLINQFIYWDNTSHDNYNRTVTRRAASKAVTSFFSQRKCLMHYPVQDGGQAHECVDTIPINGVALCLARLVLGKVTVKPARVWPSLRGQDRHNKYKRNAEIKNARDFFLFLQKTYNAFNALSTI